MASRRLAVKFKVDDTQLRSVVRRLNELEPKAARKGVKDGVNAVSKLVLDEAKALVPKRSGQLRKSLGRKVRAFKNGRGYYAVIKPRSGVWVKEGPGVVGRKGSGKKAGKVFVNKWRVEFGGQIINPVKYAHLVEYGRREVVPKEKKVLANKTAGIIFGKRVRSVPPHPFLRPAWERYRESAPRIIGAFLMRAIQALWKNSRR